MQNKSIIKYSKSVVNWDYIINSNFSTLLEVLNFEEIEECN